MNVLNRATYFRRHVVSGELTYDWATSAQHHHSFSPLVLSYEYMNSRSAAFDSIISQHPYLQISMRDQFVPKMSYTYTYNSPLDYRSPITWSTTVSEAGNILATGYMIGGRKWNEKDKQIEVGDRLREVLAIDGDILLGGTCQCRCDLELRQYREGTLLRAVLCGRCQQHPCLQCKKHRTG